MRSVVLPATLAPNSFPTARRCRPRVGSRAAILFLLFVFGLDLLLLLRDGLILDRASWRN
jgi:hypothetical protein